MRIRGIFPKFDSEFYIRMYQNNTETCHSPIFTSFYRFLAGRAQERPRRVQGIHFVFSRNSTIKILLLKTQIFVLNFEGMGSRRVPIIFSEFFPISTVFFMEKFVKINEISVFSFYPNFWLL